MTSPYGMPGKAPKGYSQGRMANYTPEQNKLFSQGMADVGPESQLYKLAHGDESQFEQMERPGYRAFNEQIGNLANRFSGQGMGARRGSGFQNATSAASSNFAQDLAAKRMGLQRQAMQDLRGMTNDLLNQRPYENYLVKKAEKQQGNWGGAASGAIKSGLSTFAATGNPYLAAGSAVIGGYSGYHGGGGLESGGSGGGNDYNFLKGNSNYNTSQAANQYDQEFRSNPNALYQ